MKIDINKLYNVERYTEKDTRDYGTLYGSDVKKILRGYTYNEEFEMWFSKKGTIGYYVTEA